MGFMNAVKTGTSYSSKIGAAGGGFATGGPSGATRGWEEGDDWMGKKYRKHDKKDKTSQEIAELRKEIQDLKSRDAKGTGSAGAATSSSQAASAGTKTNAQKSYAIKDLLAYIQAMKVSDAEKAELTSKALELESYS